MMFECARAVRNVHRCADSKPLRAESEAVEKQKRGLAARGGWSATRRVALGKLL